MTELKRPALLTLLSTLILTGCGGFTPAPAPGAATTPALQSQRIPDEPLCPPSDDPYNPDTNNPDCPTTGGPTTFFTYWTLAQVARENPRAAYVVSVIQGGRDNYWQERGAHYPAQKVLGDIWSRTKTAATYDAMMYGSTPYPGINWSDDGCSAPFFARYAPVIGPLVTLYSETFNAACRVHDFGYRNIGRLANELQVSSGQTQLVNQEALRREVDEQFLVNMMDTCFEKDFSRGLCKTVAKAFASAVRNNGSKNWDVTTQRGDLRGNIH